ncbi:MAG: bifunctional protein-serine/threonine kinase/phosphatase [Telmatospirillum sp.]|nr:bifunctional protein-serine/threonine kinase/phosphatase [Telmatospirillum sp.]
MGVGVFSDQGRRRRNEDFAGAARPTAEAASVSGQAMALADGIGGAPGGREAAEILVRGFLDGYYDQPGQRGVRRAAGAVLDALDRWIRSQGRSAGLAGMGCTFTGLVLSGRRAHVLHVGDSRLYRLRADRLVRLTRDHCLDRPGLSHVLYRAVGLDEGTRFDYTVLPLEPHDRFLLCSDGVHGILDDDTIAGILSHRLGPAETARALVVLARELGGEDNATALVADVLALPPADIPAMEAALSSLPIPSLPGSGDMIDGFVLDRILGEGRGARSFLAEDRRDGGRVVIKFPRPRAATSAAFRIAFLREAWVAATIRSPFLGTVLDLPQGRRTRLYAVMPYYPGESLEHRLSRGPFLTLEEGVRIGIGLCRALTCLHRAGVIHRDVKTDNVILEPDGGVRLIDFGAVLVPGLMSGEETDEAAPGTPGYMAPELLAGDPGSEASDVFALGVTLYRAFTGHFPMGGGEAFTTPRFEAPRSLARDRPDLPAWGDRCLARALAVDRRQRFADAIEMLQILDSGPRAADVGPARRRSLYQRDPLLVWQVLSLCLLILLLLSLACR